MDENPDLMRGGIAAPGAEPAAERVPEAGVPSRAQRSLLSRRWLILVPLLASLTVTILAMRRTSATFDEIVLIAGGARGFHTGKFDLAPDHPPLMQYLYGLPVYLTQPRYPVEAPGRWRSRTRYDYARTFFWGVGNDPERVAFAARLVAAALAAGVVLLTWGFTRRRYGPAAGIVAGTLTAFLPDVLAHGGVSYNDVPMALTYLATLWAVDSAARRPSPARGAAAGALAALALGVKFSAILIAPAALLLVLAQVIARPERGRDLALAVGAGLLAMYATLVMIYRGDLALEALRFGIGQQLNHVDAAGGAPNYLLGRVNVHGWWYFFPLAFLYKTSAALHLLMVAAAAGFAGVWAAARKGAAGVAERRRGEDVLSAARRLLASPLRVPIVGGGVFAGALMASHLDIGFRYALPILPLLCIVVAVGVVRAWTLAGAGAVRWALPALVAWHVAAPLTAYPWFISYISEYGPGRDARYEVLVDSSIDWGQGLLALRDFMRERGIPAVYLSYFGSAEPAGYGVRYRPMPSFFPLDPMPDSGPAPEWAAVSATTLVPAYVDLSVAPDLRRARPDAVVGGSIYLYRLR